MTQLLGINNFGEIGYHGSGASGQPNKGFTLTSPEQLHERETSGLGSDAIVQHQQPWGRLDSGLAMIDASGGVIFLMQWPGGPAMHFLLHELATPTVQKLFFIYHSLYGVPELLPPRLSSCRGGGRPQERAGWSSRGRLLATAGCKMRPVRIGEASTEAGLRFSSPFAPWPFSSFPPISSADPA
jgi:hypothetical protein